MSGDNLPVTAPAALVLKHTFDYAALSEDAAKHAKAAAHRIRRQEQKATEAMLEIGRDLIAVKGMLDHGQFVRWIEAECASAVRTVQNYMKAAQAFEGKYATVAHLPPSTVYALAAAPAETRAAVVVRIEEGERLTEETVKNVLWEARQERKRAAVEAKMSPRQRRSRAQAATEFQKRRAKEVAEFERKESERKQALAAAVRIVVPSLGDHLTEVIAHLETAGRCGELVEALKAAGRPV